MKKYLLSFLLFVVLFIPSTLWGGSDFSYTFFEPTSCRSDFVTSSKDFLSNCVKDLVDGIRETRVKTSRDSELLPLRISTLKMEQDDLKNALTRKDWEIEQLRQKIGTLEMSLDKLKDDVRLLKEKSKRKVK